MKKNRKRPGREELAKEIALVRQRRTELLGGDSDVGAAVGDRPTMRDPNGPRWPVRK